MARGKPKRYTPEERARRAEWMRDVTRERMRKRLLRLVEWSDGKDIGPRRKK
jgi:hypothetical protein